MPTRTCTVRLFEVCSPVFLSLMLLEKDDLRHSHAFTVYLAQWTGVVLPNTLRNGLNSLGADGCFRKQMGSDRDVSILASMNVLKTVVLGNGRKLS